MYNLISNIDINVSTKVKNSSIISKFINNNIKCNETHTELLVGTNDNYPSYIDINDNKILLKYYIKSELPYLFKIISVEKALSIQVHKNVLEYNNTLITTKQDILIALSRFEILYKFRELEDIKKFLINIEELQNLIYDKVSLNLFISNPSKILLKKIFKSFIQAPDELVDYNIINLFNTINKKKEKTNLDILICKLITLHNNIEIFYPYFINYIQLNKGESINIDINEPYSYIYGECIKCLSQSEYTIRVNLNKKDKKEKNIIYHILSYNCGYPQINYGYKKNNYTILYKTAFNELNIENIIINNDNKLYSLSIQNTYSILIVLSGRGFIISHNKYKYLLVGTIIYLENNVDCKITCTSQYEKLILYRIFKQ